MSGGAIVRTNEQTAKTILKNGVLIIKHKTKHIASFYVWNLSYNFWLYQYF